MEYHILRRTQDGHRIPIERIAKRFRVSNSYVHRIIRLRDSLLTKAGNDGRMQILPPNPTELNAPNATGFVRNVPHEMDACACPAPLELRDTLIDPDVLEVVRILKERGIFQQLRL